jgi:hypothetical protein
LCPSKSSAHSSKSLKWRVPYINPVLVPV